MRIDDLPPGLLPGRWIDEHTPNVLRLIPHTRPYDVAAKVEPS